MPLPPRVEVKSRYFAHHCLEYQMNNSLFTATFTDVQMQILQNDRLRINIKRTCQTVKKNSHGAWSELVRL
jgi:hypothetical protein